MDFTCNYLGRCGGCPSPQLSDERLAYVRALFAEAQVVFARESGQIRDRVDLTWQQFDGEMRLGLYALGSRDVLDLAECPLMTPALGAFYREFRSRAPLGVRKGSVRLRVSPQGDRGVWLDFSNEDIKNLFIDKSYLKWLSSIAFVEIGQRRKALHWVEDQPKLRDPELRGWFETYDAQGGAIPLFGPVGGFSQVGFACNQALTATVCEAVAQAGVPSWLELFGGNGNFSLALASRGYAVQMVELDALALQGLERSLELRPDLTVEVTRWDVYRGFKPNLSGKGLLVDPPRSGLREMLSHLSELGPLRPSALVYVSCFTETLMSDLNQLVKMGYQVKSMKGVDQFPNSPNIEWVTLLVDPTIG